jgi:hypothetical protein
MSIKKIYLLFAVILFGLSGCAVTDFDKSADFTRYKTFAWGESDINVKNPVYNSDLIRDRIRSTVEAEFAKRGIMKARNNPDFTVTYHTYTEKKRTATGAHPYLYRYYPYGFYPFAFGYAYPYWMMGPNHKEYTEGTLILDIFDNGSDELVWRGSVSGNVEDVGGLKKQIEKGIKAIMKKYPVSPDQPVKIGNDSNIIS